MTGTTRPYKARKPRTSPTKRQQEIIDLVCLGMSNKEIGCKLGLKEKTIKFHLTRIFIDMQVGSRTLLVLKALSARE